MTWTSPLLVPFHVTENNRTFSSRVFSPCVFEHLPKFLLLFFYTKLCANYCRKHVDNAYYLRMLHFRKPPKCVCFGSVYSNVTIVHGDITAILMKLQLCIISLKCLKCDVFFKPLFSKCQQACPCADILKRSLRKTYTV